MAEKRLTKGLLLIMAIASGICVANIYYIQPLLGSLADFFGVSNTQAGVLATCTQLGYALGLLLILPAADIINKKKLVVVMLILSAVSLITMSLCKSYTMSVPVCIAIGLTSVTPQLLVPFGAMLSEPSERGKNIGTIMSGLMIGMLASRVLSGVLGGYLGWQSFYVIAAVIMLVLFCLLIKMLPDTESNSSISYVSSVKSLFTLPKKYPVLFEAALNGFLIFAAFSAFWAVLTFYLESPAFGYSPEIVGLFGLFGIAGAAMAPIAGRMSDKRGTRYTVLFHIIVALAAITVLAVLGRWIIGIVLGTLLIDYGIQCCNVSNQARIQALSNEERNRITSVYMVCFFLGGASGSSLGSYLYDAFGWYGFISLGVVLLTTALLIHLAFSKAERKVTA